MGQVLKKTRIALVIISSLLSVISALAAMAIAHQLGFVFGAIVADILTILAGIVFFAAGVFLFQHFSVKLAGE